jgi:hypothetical protein
MLIYLAHALTAIKERRRAEGAELSRADLRARSNACG